MPKFHQEMGGSGVGPLFKTLSNDLKNKKSSLIIEVVMNLDKLFAWVTSLVIAFALSRRLDLLQRWIWQAQAKIIYESRTSTWGSPRFFKNAE